MKAVRSVWLIVFRVVVVAALFVSAVLLVEYLRPLATFCGPDSGCGAVKQSAYGRLMGKVPVPLVGLAGFGLLFLASLWRHPLRRVVLRIGSAIGALGALGFVAVMIFVIGRVCLWCAVVDGLAVAAAGAAWLGGGGEREREGLRWWAWLGTAVVAVAAPMVWGMVLSQPKVPEAIRELYEPGRINVVEFSDFECPSCRELHGKMKAWLAPHGERVHFVRRHFPLPRHKGAKAAARAVICAEKLGKGEELADALFVVPELTPEAIEAEVRWLKLDEDAYRLCSDSELPDRVLDQHRAQLKSAGLNTVPVVFIGDRMVAGLQPDEVFEEAFALAAAGEEGGTGLQVPGWAFLGGCLLVVAALVGFGRVRGERGEQ